MIVHSTEMNRAICAEHYPFCVIKPICSCIQGIQPLGAVIAERRRDYHVLIGGRCRTGLNYRCLRRGIVKVEGLYGTPFADIACVVLRPHPHMIVSLR